MQILLIMLVAGLLGGLVNAALATEPPTRRALGASALAGVGAALLVPLFLSTISSDLFEALFEKDSGPKDLFVFGSMCVLAGISSRAFIQTLSQKILREAREAKEQAQRATEEGKEAKAEAKDASQVAEAAKDAAAYGLGTAKLTAVAGLVESLPEISPGQDPDDPWKGQFGGRSEVNGRELRASFAPSSRNRDSVKIVRLAVSSTPGSPPLDGDVQFFLHPTFANPKPRVPVVDGQATIAVTSWGAFTVGALVDQGETRLELDLAKHPEATEPWRSR